MTLPFQTLTVVGETIIDPATSVRLPPADLAQALEREFGDEITVHSIDLSLENSRSLLESCDLTVLDTADVSDIETWAPPGADTFVIANHLPTSFDPLAGGSVPVGHIDPQATTGAITIFLAIAGLDPRLAFASSQTVYQAIDKRYGSWETIACSPSEPWYANRELLRHVRRLAITTIGNRRLHTLTSTSRPLLGLDSTLAITPDGNADNTISPLTIAAITHFYRQLTLVAEAENLTSGDDRSYARRPGSGGGRGLAALTGAVRGVTTPLIDTLARLTDLDNQLAQSDLVVSLIQTLHPQTVHDSIVEYLGARTTELGTIHIAITSDSSLSRHEQSEWGLNAVYAARGNDLHHYALRVLRSTWLRQA
ncbi:MAG: hypothetical protein Q4P71_05030 [Actinomycetaceae bacterium]|nr:hypothetical protein [Actinomycetaceae bacterium]